MYSPKGLLTGLRNPELAKREVHYQISRGLAQIPHDISVQGSYLTGNVGDRAIGKIFRQKCSENGYQARLFGRKVTYSRAPVRILGGGGVLQDWNGTTHLERRLGFLSEDGAVIGVGVPGFQTGDGQQIVRNGLSDVDLVTVRDEWSRRNLEPYFDGEIQVTACPVLLYDNPDETVVERTGVNFRPVFNLEADVLSEYFGYEEEINIGWAKQKYIENIKDICDSVENPVFIPFHEKDEEFARNHLNIDIYPYSFDVTKTLKRVSQVKQMVATRYHSLIFAIICNTPVYALAYQPKVSSLAERVGISADKPHHDIDIEFNNPSNKKELQKHARRNFNLLMSHIKN